MERATVPLFIIEEHNEAYFIWNYGYFKEFINPVGNTLLHVDSHHDLVVSCLNSSVDELEDDLNKIYAYAYEELGIANFIIPAIYRGIINNYTFLCKYNPYNGKRINKYVASYREEGKFFKTGEVTDLLRLELQSQALEKKWGKYQFFSYQEIGLGSKFTTKQPLILDIDLYLFSCDNSLSSAETKIEITEEAYHEFKNNKYHPFKVMPVAALSVKEEGGRYYLQYTEWQEVPGLKKVSLDVIDKRINKFLAFLKQNNIQPNLIDICRSRFSGYTPVEQWEYIENNLIAGLSQLYDLEISHIKEFEKIYGGKQ